MILPVVIQKAKFNQQLVENTFGLDSKPTIRIFDSNFKLTLERVCRNKCDVSMVSTNSLQSKLKITINLILGAIYIWSRIMSDRYIPYNKYLTL